MRVESGTVEADTVWAAEGAVLYAAVATESPGSMVPAAWVASDVYAAVRSRQRLAGYVAVAVHAGRVVGQAFAEPCDPDGFWPSRFPEVPLPAVEVGGVVVDRLWRGRGVGTALVGAVLSGVAEGTEVVAACSPGGAGEALLGEWERLGVAANDLGVMLACLRRPPVG